MRWDLRIILFGVCSFLLEVSVFDKGDFVVCGSKGVCTVEEITKLCMPGVDKDRDYYVLKPVYNYGTTVYLPVDSGEESMRRTLSKEEARSLIGAIRDIKPLSISNDKLLEQEYRGCLRTNMCEEWVKILKTTYIRKQNRIKMGRKMTAVDAKYARIAEDSLYGELAVVLDMPREKVADYISEQIDQ